MSFVMEHYEVILTILFLVSELLGSIPSLKTNSVFGMVVGVLKSALDAIKKKKEVEPK